MKSAHLWPLLLLLAPPALGQSERVQGLLRSAFPGADRFEAREIFLSDEMATRLQALSRTKISERVVTFYTASAAGQVVGYAALHSQRVRTKAETLLVSFEPDGRIHRIDVVSFLEPPEYQPPAPWLAQFGGRGAGDRLAVGDDIQVLSGATLSARSVADGARWLLQAFQAGKVGAP